MGDEPQAADSGTQIPVNDQPAEQPAPAEPTAEQEHAAGVETATPTPASAAVDLDLDQLVPSAKKVRFNGKIVEVKQPTTEQLFQLLKLGKQLEGMDEKNLDEAKLEEVLTQITDQVTQLAPEFGEAKLTLGQALAVTMLISQMAMPNELKELQTRGITPATLPKDAPSS